MPYEVVGASDGTFRLVRRGTGEIVVIDGQDMTGLTAGAAAEYVYALGLVEAARNVSQPSRIRQAVKRAVRRSDDKPVRSMDDAVVAVKWMLPDLGIADDVLRLLIRKFSAEMDVILLE